MDRSTRDRGLASLPLLAALLVYAPALPGAAPVLDDAALIVGHARPGDVLGEWTSPTYAAAGGAPSFVWRPLVASAWHVLGALAGREIAVYRAFNLGLLLGLLVLFQAAARRLGAGAGLASALALGLALHPALTDAVAWAACAPDLAAAALLVAAVLGGLSGRGAWWVGGFALAAALCKETALGALPAVPVLLWLGGARARVGAVALAGLVFLGAHRAVVGLGAPVLLSAEVGRAWLALAGLAHGPVQAGFGHLLHATGSVGWGWTLPVVCLGAGLALRGPARRAALGAAGLWLALLAPVAVGVAHIGLVPMRYLVAPLALAALPLALLPVRGGAAAGLGVALALALGPRAAARAQDWRSERDLWAAERALEPDNPYLARQQAATAWAASAQASPEARRALLQAWGAAIAAMPRALGFYDPVGDWLTLAKAAFLSGEPALALAAVDRYLAATGAAADREAWCLRADALERTGGPDAALAEADARCRAQ